MTDPSAQAAVRAGSAGHGGVRKWFVLAAAILSTLAATMVAPIISLNSPSVSADLGLSSSTVQLAASIPALVLAAAVLLAGTLGDVYGRKKFLVAGNVLVTVGCLVAAAAPGGTLLIIGLGICGLGASAGIALSIAALSLAFAPEERASAFGFFAAGTGLLGALAPIAALGLSQALSWRAGFLVPGILGALGAFFALVWIPDTSVPKGTKRVDIPGVLFFGLGIFGLVYGFTQLQSNGTRAAACIGAGLMAFLLFAWWENRSKDPAFRLSLLRNPAFTVGLLMGLVLTMSTSGVQMLIAVFFQMLRGYSPVLTSVAILPNALAAFVAGLVAGKIAKRYGVRRLAIIGMGIFAIGFIFLAGVTPGVSYVLIAVGMACLGFGFSAAISAQSTLIMANTPPRDSGIGAAAKQAFQSLGTSLGTSLMIALFTMFASGFYRSGLADAGISGADAAKVDKAMQAAIAANANTGSAALPDDVRDALVAGYKHVFTAGLNRLAILSLVLTVATIILVAFVTKPKHETPTTPAGETASK